MKFLALTSRISFLLFAFCVNCKKPDSVPEVAIISKDQKSVGLSIKGIDITQSELPSRLRIQLIKKGNQRPVLGEFEINGDGIIFEPLVPLTSGLRYAVILDDTVIAEIKIPETDNSAPELLSIFPSSDTLPENLLKMYLQFSRPMVEGRSLQYLMLVRSDGDTLNGTFLDLQPELWNAESTVLTLWLDPGRIKRDLIPNKELGTPLNQREQYTLHVSSSWPGKDGSHLLKAYSKTFVTSTRDATSPDLSKWKLHPPRHNSRDAFEISVPEPLDNFLFADALRITTEDGASIMGEAQVSNNEKAYKFTPEKPWIRGKYILHIEARLEDVAGNNLNRPFDRVVESSSNDVKQNTFTKQFEIR